jgi:hypothetical protein
METGRCVNRQVQVGPRVGGVRPAIALVSRSAAYRLKITMLWDMNFVLGKTGSVMVPSLARTVGCRLSAVNCRLSNACCGT